MGRMMKIITTTGDCNGIGAEVFAKSIAELSREGFFTDTLVYIAASPETLSDYYSRSGRRDFDWNLKKESNILIINNIEIPVIPLRSTAEVNFGSESADAGALAAESIIKAVDSVISGEFDALVTLPISKAVIYKSGWKFPGHTEMLADKCSVENPLMILGDEKNLVALATIHVPVSAVPALITREHLIERIDTFHRSLQYDFGIGEPKIAVLGLNPHAGENGGIGKEEINIINPVISEFQNKGMLVEGSFPADGFFAHGSYTGYDGILAMYHDQGLIPVKMLAKGGGINFTAGLPIVRTSPDHGTAFQIAGRGIADHRSTYQALKTAKIIADNRKNYDLKNT